MNHAPHLVRTRIDARALNLFAARHGVLDGDLGYAIHLALRRRFGAAAPQPFRLFEPEPNEPNYPRLLGYAEDPAALQLPPGLPDPDVDWTDDPSLGEIFPNPFEAKKMPHVWPDGLYLSFELRLRPIVRLKTALPPPSDRVGSRRHGFAAGSEVDAYLAEALRDPDRQAMARAERTREDVYRDWLAARLGDAADLRDVTLTRFHRSVVARGGKAKEGPDAVMTGTLAIRNGRAFAEVVARGVGRHRAFGYGMLLLRPGGRG